jgi:hypothetical protein
MDYGAFAAAGSEFIAFTKQIELIRKSSARHPGGVLYDFNFKIGVGPLRRNFRICRSC